MTTDGVFVPRKTLQSVMKQLKDKSPTLDNCFPIEKKRVAVKQQPLGAPRYHSKARSDEQWRFTQRSHSNYK